MSFKELCWLIHGKKPKDSLRPRTEKKYLLKLDFGQSKFYFCKKMDIWQFVYVWGYLMRTFILTSNFTFYPYSGVKLFRFVCATKGIAQ